MTKAQYQKAREELLVMLVCTVLVALLMFYVIPVLIKVPAAALKDDSFTPRTFPYFLGTIMAICVLIGDVKTGVEFVRARREALACGCLKEAEPKKTLHDRITGFIPWIVYALVVLYGVGITRIGFVIPTVLMIPVVLLLLRCRKWRYYLYVYLFSGGIWVVFRYVLHVQLP